MRIRSLILPLSLIAISGLAQDVRYDYARNADFSKYKTYAWAQVNQPSQMSQLMEQKLKQSIEAELVKKGLSKVEEGAADLLLVLQVALTQEKEFSSYSTDFGYGPGWGRGWYGGGMGSTTTTGQTSTIHIGAVGLDFYDTVGKALIWRGEATKTLNTKAKPDKLQKNIDKGVAKLLKNFPPPPPKG